MVVYSAGSSDGAGTVDVLDTAWLQFRDGRRLVVVLRRAWWEDGHGVDIDTVDLGARVTVQTREAWHGMY